ncbi:AAA family ATPase [Blautia massiliensis (ex Durand et al. 2017)]|uniref:metallophosphoesterase n=1 Tax=Clostridia TaxID=186801 RepID=UPI000397CCD2|nr:MULTISPECIES: AAA family ATPase [Blautia]ERI96426.1 exonuclease SbcCD, D subunit [Blautia sp. KLE 1732]UEA28941.1 AAA family ATPase [Blautia massiliensis (ex Durand et al. 2017)]UWO17333.1 AAA family ATPase [Blautia sp. KLE_1732_HM_1032]
MKILHTADWHIGQFKGPVVDGVNLRSQDTVKCLEYMVDVAIKERPDIVCISGDIFHQEQIGPVRYSDEMIHATNIITSLAHFAGYVIVMRGTPNHDGSGQFRVLKRMLLNVNNVCVVTEPFVIKTKYADIACIPGFDKQEFRAKFPGLSADEENLAWTKYISDMVFALRAECEKTPILMAHYTVPGCNMESGQTSFFTNFEPVIPREALIAARYEAVLLGHIHRPQIIEGFDNVFYSGAINAMNFNDEGQDRGFWIHEFNEKGTLVKGHRYTTPYRQFRTITWDPDEVGDYIREGAMYLHRTGISEDVTDKIVRVRYSCTSEQKKALNIPLLQKNLYELGAFYVADIEAESTIDITNRGLLSEESDPRLNLKKWLEEKTFKNPDKIVELAEPIIAEAMKQSTTAEIHGVFKPVSISVRNYRNYKEENFDFSDISFCTINGVNGAGKSSLFMDAIVDCLFEETREGDCKAWIRGTEDARSGSIEFIFDIGEKRFRVVRTRTKSGKPTLNLSQYQKESADWMNLSKERIIDTQAEIEKLLGMDSMTFRSCALIMQDQYGLFLQAKKDERIAILGNLLGLGIYGVMELDSKKKLSEQRKELASKKEAVRIKTDFIKSKGDPESELQKAEEDIQQLNKDIEDLSDTQGQLLNKHAQIEKAEQECRKASEELDDCHKRRRSISDEISSKTQILENCNAALESANEVREKAAEYKQLSEQIIELEKDVLNHDNAKRNLAGYNADIQNCQNIINDAKRRNNDIANLIEQLKAELPDNLEEKLTELAQARTQCEELQEKRHLTSVAEQELQQIRATYSQRISEAENRRKYRLDRISEIRQQEEFMKNSGCPDIDRASCRFLAKAIDDVKSLPEEADHLEKCEEEIAALRIKRDEEISKKQDEICIIGYDAERLELLIRKARALVKYENLKKDAEKKKLEIARLETEKNTNSKTIGQYEEILLELNIKAQKATDIVAALSDSVIKHDDAVCKRNSVAHFADQEKELPVYEERKQHIDKRLTELYQERSKEDANELVLHNNLREAEIKLEELRKDIEGSEALEEVERRLKSTKETLEKAQIQKGVLTQRVEDVEAMRSEIALLNKGIAVAAEKADCYEALKQAFSQDGVPHQIIRNIIPHITDTTNNILGQMTGGTMGVEFVMERTVKGKDGDKATLDVLINEYGKTTLPYASKSGGEKVKASLAVILALSEIKATAAGIQLGMLFIDEPPFLDDEGAQAYVDALETIRDRYSDVKIMAITHDDAMKARFGQAVTVIKTDDGSKVIY